jgi:predicted nucleic acid-binding Zn ribbon protein
MRWSEQETKKVVELTKNGYNSTKISEILNRSKKSIKCKLKKLGETYEKYNKKEKEIRYCVNCGEEITTKSGKKFCGHSCSAIYNNKKRKKIRYCINCENELSGEQKKYCSTKCNGEHKRNLIFEKIENGDTTLYFKNYKNYLIHKYGEKCMECGWCEINPYSNKIPIELEHMDGISENNSLDNLKLLCPNCHSLTSTYKSLNMGNGRHKRMERYYEGKSF